MRRSASSIEPGLALLPLRLFLGVTFVYAGIQKLSDPGFLHPGAPTYIGTQLVGFANGSPGGFILRTFAIPHPIVAGVGVAILEIAIGLCAFSGLLTRYAAAGGLALNLLLFGTASWHTSPYFLGPDIVFVFAWLPFVLIGAEDQPALDHVIARGSPAVARRVRLSTVGPDPGPEETATLTRRALVTAAGAATLALAGIAALAKGSYTGPALNARAGSGAAPGPERSRAHASAGASDAGGSGAQASTGVPSNAVKIGPSSKLPNGQAALYRDPSNGQPDIAIRQPDGSLTAFSAVCTHAGCTVGYQSGEIVCPCHGGTYSAATGAVTGGPPPAPLAQRKLIEQKGEIYAVPS
jgi:thiosulfate dehydrogenase (quinone) large subunit